MFLAAVLRNALLILVPVSFILSTYLYLYPLFHLCAFPAPEHTKTSSFSTTLREHIPFSRHEPNNIAPFRLLALGDPQLEGESPLYDPQAPAFPNLWKFWKDALLLNGTKHNPLQRLRHSLHDLTDFYLDDIPSFLDLYRKRLDHIGNDYYLGHIYRTISWWADPTHVTVLGDLVGSQWIDDKEFENRGWRYWNRVFRGGVRVPEELASPPTEEPNNVKVLGDDAAAWKRRVINVAGNHDIGYAGDLSPARMDRFVRVFGKANYELRFQMPVNHSSIKLEGVEGEEEKRPIPELRIIVLNDMNLDAPATSKELQDETYEFLNEAISTSQDVTRPAHFTLMLTHIPLHKKAGVCVDGPFFSFFDGYFNNGIEEQNHLSQDASKGFLEGVFGMSAATDAPGEGFGRHGLVLNGHDHEGCDTYHYINQSAPPAQEWLATRWEDAQSSRLDEEPDIPGLREITVRSMMGSFSGNAGMLSLWFDEETWDWNFEFANCRLGTQHIWWLVHILDLITLGVGIVYGVVVGARKMIPAEDPMFMMKRMGSDEATAWKTKTTTSGKGGDDNNEVMAARPLASNGKLDVPSAGKKSLRRKRSGRILNGGSNGGHPLHE